MSRPLTRLALVAWATTACPAPQASCEGEPVERIDADGDGYVLADDCDDADPLIHPGAFDACDAVDNDCNDVVDDGYADVDGDGSADCVTQELCNGADDDGDGAVDEGFDNFDGDLVADCLDDECDVPVPAEGTVSVDVSCVGSSEVADPWDIVEKWSGGVADPLQGLSAGRILDLDGDGDVDSDDPPTIVMNEASTDLVGLRLMSGLDGTTKATIPLIATSTFAIADIDGDGAAEIFADVEGFVALFETDGTEVWRDTVSRGSTIAIADLDGDGDAEVFHGGRALNATDGTLVFDLGEDDRIRDPAIGDIDLDGDQEIIYKGAVWDATGIKVFDLPAASGASTSWPAIVQVDSDPEAEIVLLSEAGIAIIDHTGAVVQSNAIAGTTGGTDAGPPTLADLDGDGELEIAFMEPFASPFPRVLAVELDGTVMWLAVAAALDDEPDYTGMSAFDFDGDGASEVIFPSLNGVKIYDGTLGTQLFSMRETWFNAYNSVPVIADIDNDGAAEIISLAQSGVRTSVVALEQRSDTWPGASAQWTQFGWAGSNVGPEASIIAAPPYWQVDNIWRAQTALLPTGADFVIEIADVCVSSCDPTVGVAAVAVTIGNRGSADWAGGVSVSLYADDGGSLTRLATQVVSGVDSGEQTAGLVFDIALTDIGSSGLAVRVDASAEAQDGLVDECSETNNQDVWSYTVCP